MNVVILFLDNKPHHRSWRNGEGMEESPRESLKRTLTGLGPMGVLRYVQYGFMLSSLVLLAVVTVSYKQKRPPRVVLYSETVGSNSHFR